jgi:hypothetical protein
MGKGFLWLAVFVGVGLASMGWWLPAITGEAGDAAIQQAAAEEQRKAGRAELRQIVADLRRRIDVYIFDHGEKLPGIGDRGWFDGTLFVKQLTSRTDAEGNVLSGSEGGLGPYVLDFPANPLVEGAAAARVSGGSGAPPHDGKTGWWLNTDTGKLYSNHGRQ